MSTVDEIAAGGVTPGDFASLLASALTVETATIAAAAITTAQAAVAARAAGYQATATAAHPNATHAVNGTAATLAADAGFSGLGLIADVSLAYVTGTETVTTTVTATFDDSTTASITDTRTSTGTNVLSGATLDGLAKTGHYVTALAVAAKSSIDSSTATVTATVRGLEVR